MVSHIFKQQTSLLETKVRKVARGKPRKEDLKYINHPISKKIIFFIRKYMKPILIALKNYIATIFSKIPATRKLFDVFYCVLKKYDDLKEEGEKANRFI